jgi:Spy/CpxP family protein refolding chaperone
MLPKKLITWFVVPAVALAMVGGFFSASAQGQRGQRGEGRGGPPPIEKLAERLDLTAEQQAQIETMRDEGESERLEYRKQLMQLKNQLEGEWLKDELNERTLKSLTEQLGEIRTKMQLQHLEHRLELREVLTPAQWDKLLTSRKGWGHGHRGHGPRGRGSGNSEAGNWRDR